MGTHIMGEISKHRSPLHRGQEGTVGKLGKSCPGGERVGLRTGSSLGTVCVSHPIFLLTVSQAALTKRFLWRGFLTT